MCVCVCVCVCIYPPELHEWFYVITEKKDHPADLNRGLEDKSLSSNFGNGDNLLG